jgi:hypothetical protein
LVFSLGEPAEPETATAATTDRMIGAQVAASPLPGDELPLESVSLSKLATVKSGKKKPPKGKKNNRNKRRRHRRP